MATAATGAFGAEEGEGVTAKGGCSLGSQWTLHMGVEIGIVFEVEINSGVPGQTWNVELRYNKPSSSAPRRRPKRTPARRAAPS